jgi:predicted neuraminidase
MRLCRENHPVRRCALVGIVLFSGTVAAAAATPATILPAPDGQTNHGPGLAELDDGRLLACWYSGSSEGNADSRILCADSADKGAHWTDPRPVVEPGEQADGARNAAKSVGNVTLHRDGAGRLWLIYGVIQRWTWPLLGNVCRNWFCGRVDGKVSTDQGDSWSGPLRLDDDVGALPRSRPVLVPGLGDVLPLYHEGQRRAYLRILDLAAWTGGAAPASRVVTLPGEGVIQPALQPTGDGGFRIYLRDSRGRLVRTTVWNGTDDQAAPVDDTDVPNPDSAVEVFAGADGATVLLFNPENRLALRLADSQDGRHFHQGCDLVSPGAEGEVAYPAVIRGSDGVWHVLYSSDGKRRIRHRSFDAAWLRACLDQ